MDPSGAPTVERVGAAKALLGRLAREERLRFLVVGGANTGFAYLFFATLVLVAGHRIHYLWILLITHVVTILTAFTSQRLLVFRVRGRVLGDVARFWLVNVGALLLNFALLPLLVEVFRIPVLLAQAMVMALIAVTSYLGYKHFSFRRPPEG